MGQCLTSQVAWFMFPTPLPGVFKSSQLPPWKTSIMSITCCPPLTQPPEISPLPGSRQRRAAASSGAVCVGGNKTPVALSLSLPVPSHFFTLGQWTDVQLCFLNKVNEVGCVLLLACVIAAGPQTEKEKVTCWNFLSLRKHLTEVF